MGRINTTNADTAGLKNISSAAGYSAGDLIYQSASDTGAIPDNFVATADFPVVGTLAADDTSSVSDSRTLFKTVFRDGGSGCGRSVAKLSNGNTVVGYIRPSSTTNKTSTSFPYFVVLDDDYNEVVAPVQVTTSTSEDINYNSNFKLSVTALSNGNFVITWQASSYNQGTIYSKVFQANGSPVSGSLVNLSYYETTGFRNFSVKALPNGNFVVIYFAGNQNTWTCFEYQNDGTAVGQATNIYTGNSGSVDQYALDTAVFSDSSYITYFANGANIYWFKVLSGGTGAASTGTYTAGVGSIRALTVSVNSADEAILSFNSQSNSDAYAQKFLNTGQSSGSRLTIDTTPQDATPANSDAETGMASLIYSGTDNMLVYGENIRSYNFVISTTGALSVSREPSYTYYSAGNLGALSLIEYSEGARLFECFRGRTIINSQQGQWGGTVARSIDDNGFVAQRSTQKTVGSLTATVNGYARQSSTPTGASFLSSETKTEIVTIPKTTTTEDSLAIGKQEVTDYVVNGSACHALSNGNVLILAVGNTPYPVTAYVYDYNGNLVTSKFIANINYSSADAWRPQVCNLENGNVVVALASGTYTVEIYVLNPSTLDTISTRTQSTVYNNLGGFRVCTVPSTAKDMYAIAYQKYSSQQTWVAIARQDGTVIQDFDMTSWLSPTSTQSMGVACSLRGDIYLMLQRGGQNHIFSKSVRLSETSWQTTTQNLGSFGGSSYRVRGNNPLHRSLNGCIAAITKDNSAYTNIYMYDDTICQSSGTYQEAVSEFQSTNNVYQSDDFCFTADGVPVLFSFQNGNTDYGYVTFTYSAQEIEGEPVRMNGFWVPDSGSPCLSICSPAGNRVFVAFRDNSSDGYLRMFAIEAAESSYSKTVTSGVDTSNKVALDSRKTALVGVSVTDCAAGETGAVQTKGSAKLSNQYPADTAQSGFDFTQPTADGVKGTINGRNLLISGD